MIHSRWCDIAADWRHLIRHLANVEPCISFAGKCSRRTAIVSIALAGILTTGPTGGEAKAESEPAYIGSSACAACHQPEYSAWSKSHHSWAWRVPNDDNVLADFAAQDFIHKGVATRFSRSDGRYIIATDGPHGRPTEYEVKATVGVAPLQQYLVETELGRWQALDVAWDTVQKRWYHLYPDGDDNAGDGLHWTGPYKNWNARCAECHATAFDKGYDIKTKAYQSTQAEIGVGCEACHGPGEAHRAWAEAPKSFEASEWRSTNQHGLTVAFTAEANEPEIQQCAGCHSRREPLAAASPRPGAPFADHYRLALLRDGLYHPDGQILDEVYIHGSFLQSKMFAKGVRCSNCHEPHSGDLRASGNGVCTQCHNPEGNPKFSSLRKALYDAPEHHFHETGTSAAACVNCHMPERLYMVVDGRRDHSFRVPRPDLSEKLGTPNACTACHAEKSSAWASRAIEMRFPNGRQRTPHYGEIIAEARKGITKHVRQNLLALAGDRKTPQIARATALDLLKNSADPKLADATAVYLNDTSPLIRMAAIATQRPAPPPVRAQRIASLLKDQAKVVRIEAARALLNIPPERLPPEVAAALRKVMREYQDTLVARADFPEIQMVIGGTALVLRNWRAAEQAFGEAVAQDPQLARAWLMIARIQASRGDRAAADRTLRRATEAIPTDSALNQFHAGILARQGKREEAVAALQRAIALEPDEPTIQADLGVLLSDLGRHEEAVTMLERAESNKAVSAGLLYALYVSRLAVGDREAAELARLKLELLCPRSPLNERTQQRGK